MTSIRSFLTGLKSDFPAKTGLLALCAVFVFCVPRADARMPGQWNHDFFPGSYLLYPVTDHIDLAGKEYLEFKWERGALAFTDCFDFRIYKGYDTVGANLIFKQRFSPAEYPVKVPSSMFEINQVYTWVLVQVFTSGQKSDRSHSSFKIIKK
jgi:hypothetical protein